MPETRRGARTWLAVIAITCFMASALVRGDTVVMKNGVSYRGVIDRDNTIIWIYDGLKRVVVRDSKVARVEPDAGFKGLEVFKIEQPLVVHAGAMPKEIVSVTTAPWNDRGRRAFAYEARPGRVTRMEQAVNELGPYLCKIRGVDGYWQGQLATSQFPREVVLAILAKVDQKDKNERIRVARFLIQTKWNKEARAELDRLASDFPDDADLRERVTAAKASITQLDAIEMLARIDRTLPAQQFHERAALLKAYPDRDAGAEQVSQVEALRRAWDAQTSADKMLADDLRVLADRLPDDDKAAWKRPLLEVLQAMKQAPDAVRDRFVAWQKIRDDPAKTPYAQFAVALSGYVVGSDAAIEDLAAAKSLWSMRDLVRAYLASRDDAKRAEVLAKLEALTVPAGPDQPIILKKLDLVTRLAQLMPPALHDDDGLPAAGKSKRHRVLDDQNADPTEYSVMLPPEYHPLRSYPTILALHDGSGPDEAIGWWSAEAARRGYIVVAPEYLPAGIKEYRYTESEHASIELALRDARRRYAIDSDRVFLGGQLVGGNAVWDFGLGHPDLFAGIATINGMPFKYGYRYLTNSKLLPMYVTLGDLVPAGTELVFGQLLKPLILKAQDITYLEYLKRGPEDLPEEVPGVFDWMDHRRREPAPKSFDAVTARGSDNRFFGLVIREFQTGRTTAPEAVDGFGKNLSPATIKMSSSSLSNLLRFDTVGLKRFDVWVSPKLIDFKKRLEVRVNGKSFFKSLAKPELEPVLEDLRIRGDRQQVYWLKVPVG